jgi:hypothetical protein
MQPKTHSAIVRPIFLSLFVILFVFFIYTFLHEAGHAIVGLAVGQSLTEFNVSFWDFSAHVDMSGGELTQSQLAVQAAAGVTLPLLVWAVFIRPVPRKASFILETLKLISSMVVLNTLLAWIVIPVLYISEKAPASEDVTNFLNYSHLPPLLLTFTVLMLYICGWAYFLSKIDGLYNELLLFRDTEGERLTAGTRRMIPLMTGIMAFCLVLVFLLNSTATKNRLNQLSPPSGFEVVAEVNLSRQDYSAETLAEFALEEPASMGVFIVVRNIHTGYFDLSVIGPDGYSSVVLHGEGYRADRDGGLWQENLLPGTYRLVLTSHRSPGTASVFLKTR